MYGNSSVRTYNSVSVASDVYIYKHIRYKTRAVNNYVNIPNCVQANIC